MSDYAGIQDVAEAVAENGDLLAVTLGQLREALGYNRLGNRVLAEIATSLNENGLGYFPAWVLDENEVPRFGNVVRVYKKGTALAQLVEAVVDPTEVGDERLRETSASGAGAAAVTLERIAALINGSTDSASVRG